MQSSILLECVIRMLFLLKFLFLVVHYYIIYYCSHPSHCWEGCFTDCFAICVIWALNLWQAYKYVVCLCVLCCMRGFVWEGVYVCSVVWEDLYERVCMCALLYERSLYSVWRRHWSRCWGSTWKMNIYSVGLMKSPSLFPSTATTGRKWRNGSLH